MNRRTRYAPLVLCAGLAIVAAACGSDSKSSATTVAAPAASAAPTATAAPVATDAAPAATDAATDTATAGATGKIGFITKFPVDFYDTMVDAAKAWNADHPEIELIFAQGASGTAAHTRRNT